MLMTFFSILCPWNPKETIDGPWYTWDLFGSILCWHCRGEQTVGTNNPNTPKIHSWGFKRYGDLGWKREEEVTTEKCILESLTTEGANSIQWWQSWQLSLTLLRPLPGFTFHYLNQNMLILTNLLLKWEQPNSFNLSVSTTVIVFFHNSFSSSFLTPMLLDYQQNSEFWHRLLLQKGLTADSRAGVPGGTCLQFGYMSKEDRRR